MNLQTRRLIVLIFIIIFLIIAPIVLLFSLGFRYNFKKNKIEHIGSLVFSTLPNEIKIQINNKEYNKQKKNFVVNYLPNYYTVKFSKNNYHSWQENIELQADISHFFNIRLFKKSVPQQEIKTTNEDIFISSDKQNVIFTRNNYLYYNQLKNIHTPQKLIEIKNIKNVIWNKDNDKIIVFSDNSLIPIQILSLSNYAEDKIIKLKNTNTQKALWSQPDSNTIYYLLNNNFIKQDLSENTPEIIFENKENIIDFTISDKELFFVTKGMDPKKLYLYKLDVEANKNSQFITYLPISNNIELNNTLLEENTLLIKDHNNNLMYFINPKGSLENNDSIINILYNTNSCQKNTEKELICSNKFEIFHYSLQTNKKTLITRFSKKIEDIIILKNSENIFVVNNNIIKAIYLKNNSIIDIIKLDKIKKLFIDEKEENLYFWANIGNNSGIFKLEI